MRHIDLDEVAEFSSDGHIKKDILKTQGFNSVPVCQEDGQEIPPHPEPYYVLFIILEGEGTITAGTEPCHVKPGHMVFVDKDEVRGIKCRRRMRIIGVQQPH
jgi:quercetin dioxygenase-like cupin family protein